MTTNVQAAPSEPLVRQTSTGYANITVIDTATLLFSITSGRTGRITKIMGKNRSAVGGDLEIGYLDATATFVRIFPRITVLSSLDFELTESELPGYWFRYFGYKLADIYGKMQAPMDAEAVPVEVFLEVEEKGLS